MVISGKKEKILDFKFVYDILFFPPSPIKPFKQRRYCLNIILFWGTNSLSSFYLERKRKHCFTLEGRASLMLQKSALSNLRGCPSA